MIGGSLISLPGPINNVSLALSYACISLARWYMGATTGVTVNKFAL